MNKKNFVDARVTSESHNPGKDIFIVNPSDSKQTYNCTKKKQKMELTIYTAPNAPVGRYSLQILKDHDDHYDEIINLGLKYFYLLFNPWDTSKFQIVQIITKL